MFCIYTRNFLRGLPSLRSPINQTVRTITYDGTAKSLAYDDSTNDALSDNIETVELAYQKLSPPGFYANANHPIVFLHGLFGSKANNKTVSRKLAMLLDREVYCVDMRNHGESPHNSRMDYPAMSADVERFIDDHNLKSPVLIGHSMGAKAAMGVCLRKPDLCSLLIPVDNAPVDYTSGAVGFSKFGKYIKQMQKIDHNKDLQSLGDCDNILASVEKNKIVRQFLLTNMKPEAEGGYRCRVPLDIMAKTIDNISAWPFDSQKSRWTGPTLFIRGSDSAMVADEYMNAIAQFFPRFEIQDIKAGHWLISEQPEAFVAAVCEWVMYQEAE